MTTKTAAATPETTTPVVEAPVFEYARPTDDPDTLGLLFPTRSGKGWVGQMRELDVEVYARVTGRGDLHIKVSRTKAGEDRKVRKSIFVSNPS